MLPASKRAAPATSSPHGPIDGWRRAAMMTSTPAAAGAGGAMTSEQATLIRTSFDAMWPIRRQLAEHFYSRFFELVPEARRMFPADMEKQRLKLMDMIAAIVGSLDQRDLLQSLIAHS